MDIKGYALRLLKYRTRSEEELRRRLKNKGFKDTEIENLIFEFKEKGLVDDIKFSYLFAYDKLTIQKKGPKLIEWELLKLGVKKEIVDEAISKVLQEVDEEKIIREILMKERIDLENGKEKRRLYSKLTKRGFNYYSIESVLSSIFDN
ncbi:MAG TPA: RecX family transcriptional regulator [Thermotogaceae bacterium]|nr:RecX family transcriptional regulator [Thermotogaceae bacterium]